MDDVRLERARPSDIERLLPLVAAYHAFEAVRSHPEDDAAAVRPHLADPRLGEMWTVELAGSLVGYVAVCFGFSLEFGGRDAFVDEFYLEPRARGLGIGRHALEGSPRPCGGPASGPSISRSTATICGPSASMPGPDSPAANSTT